MNLEGVFIMALYAVANGGFFFGRSKLSNLPNSGKRPLSVIAGEAARGASKNGCAGETADLSYIVHRWIASGRRRGLTIGMVLM